MDFKALIPLVLSALSVQELALVTTELTALFSATNVVTKAALTDAEISAAVSALVKLAFAEQNALVAMLTAKTAVTK